MKTFVAKPHEVKRDWYVVDADGKTLGRLAAELASRLRGKHKAIYTPHVDCGDYMIVINAEKIAVTGAKRTDKMYYRHTGYVGNMKSASFEKMIERSPERVLELAVKGMLPWSSTRSTGESTPSSAPAFNVSRFSFGDSTMRGSE